MAQENTKELTAVQLSEQEGFRRDKLKALQEAGNDPFEIVKYDVTHHSSEVLNGFDELEGKVVVGKVDVDENRDLAGEFGVMSIPTVIYFKNGVEVKRFVGVQPKEKLLEAAKELE